LLKGGKSALLLKKNFQKQPYVMKYARDMEYYNSLIQYFVEEWSVLQPARTLCKTAYVGCISSTFPFKSLN
jgi:hypothetical protein